MASARTPSCTSLARRRTSQRVGRHGQPEQQCSQGRQNPGRHEHQAMARITNRACRRILRERFVNGSCAAMSRAVIQIAKDPPVRSREGRGANGLRNAGLAGPPRLSKKSCCFATSGIGVLRSAKVLISKAMWIQLASWLHVEPSPMPGCRFSKRTTGQLPAPGQVAQPVTPIEWLGLPRRHACRSVVCAPAPAPAPAPASAMTVLTVSGDNRAVP